MTWVKLDDLFSDHPKIIAAGPAAGWLYVCGLCYAGRYLTDGFIPAGQIGKLADMPTVEELAARLVGVGLWEAAEGGYQIHDFLIYNRTREQVLAERAEDAQRQAEWRARRAEQRAARHPVTNTVTNSVSHGVSPALVTGSRIDPVEIPSVDLDLSVDRDLTSDDRSCCRNADPDEATAATATTTAVPKPKKSRARKTTRAIREEIERGLRDEFGDAWVDAAMKKAVKLDKHSLGYVEGTLRGWRDEDGHSPPDDRPWEDHHRKDDDATHSTRRGPASAVGGKPDRYAQYRNLGGSADV